MNVLLLHLDGDYPNLALMLLFAYYRALGVYVELRRAMTAEELQPRLGDPAWGLVFGSLIFERTRPLADLARRIYPSIVLGGTGWDFGDGSKRKPGGVIELPYLDGVQHAEFPNVERTIHG